MKRIYLIEFGNTEPSYEVIKLVGSVQYRIGSKLTREQVKDLCDLTGMWKVTIT